MPDIEIQLYPGSGSKFNDKNGDGLGEFEGWGTSLCWWANRLGYNKNLINKAVNAFYSKDGLDLNIGRYNIGGGDNVTYSFETPYVINSSNKKVVFDLKTSGLKPEHFGNLTEITTNDELKDTSYTTSDSDFGISSGSKVGTVDVLTYINALGEARGDGDNPRFAHVNIQDKGKYTVKLIMIASDRDNRGVGIRVNKKTDYLKSYSDLTKIATNGTKSIYMATFTDVKFKQGRNLVDIGGNGGYAPDLIKMAVVRGANVTTSSIKAQAITTTGTYETYGPDDYRSSYNGTSMKVQSIDALKDTKYTRTDESLGIKQGSNVGTITKIGYINKLDDNAVLGGNLSYSVDAPSAGDYTIKLLVTISKDYERDIAIRVNDVKYHADATEVNQTIVASNDYQKMFIVTFSGVTLKSGSNRVYIGGYTSWTYDLVKMSVIKGEVIITPDPNPEPPTPTPEPDDDDTQDTTYLHSPHITRSDSVVPGYWKNVTKITSDHTLDWYSKNYERVDQECGFAWNYDWDADRYQLNMTKAIAKVKGSEFIAEAFSNSPPYFMTKSGCSSGNWTSSQTNLRDDSQNAFAKYMADVIAHINNDSTNGFKFTSATPMNEPSSDYWSANSNKQEGCHIEKGYDQSKALKTLSSALKSKGVTNCILSAADESQLEQTIDAYNALDTEAKKAISRIDTHSYGGSNRSGIRELAEKEGKNLWMSEVDGDFTGGSNAGEMTAGLGFAQHVIKDLAELRPSAWILWDIVDMHTDTGNVHDGNDLSWLNYSGGYWGMSVCRHDDEDIWLLKKYYVYGQFTKYIRPGYMILPTSSEDSIAAYDPDGHKLVVVAVNREGSDKYCDFNLNAFNSIDAKQIKAIRTSGPLNGTGRENWADVSNSVSTSYMNEYKKFGANLKSNSVTTFIVDNVVYGGALNIDSLPDITVSKGQEYYTTYHTSAPVVKHEFSWGDGVFTDEQQDHVEDLGNNTYRYRHDADTEYEYFNFSIRVTDADGNTATTTFRITFTSGSTSIKLNPISDMSVNKGERFDIKYTTNISAVKHEVSWGDGVFTDVTSEVDSSGTTYTYHHDDQTTNYDYFNFSIRVTDSNGNTDTKTFRIDLNGTTSSKISLDSISDMTVKEGEKFNVVYHTNISAVKHEFSWNGTEFWDKTAEIRANGTTYTYVHDANTGIDYFNVHIRVTDGEGNTDEKVFKVTFTKNDTPVTPPKPGGDTSGLLDSTGGYVVDDFNGTTLNRSLWSYEQGWVRNNETQRYVTTNTEVKDSLLYLKGLKDSSGNWTSSSVISLGNFSFKYGTIVGRCKFCNSAGSFPAFWTLGDMFTFGYKEWEKPDDLGEWWPWCGEFDVCEFYSGNLTCGIFYEEGGTKEAGRVWYNNYPTGDWHEFSMEWRTDGSMTFKIDGNWLSEVPANNNRATHIPQYILLNQAVGASGGTPDANCTSLISCIDWVKYYPLSTDNLKEYPEDYELYLTDKSDNNVKVRIDFKDNSINKTMVWTSSDESVLKVTNGLVYTAWSGATGSAVIRATNKGGTAYKEITVEASNGKISSATDDSRIS